ncbi:hypothetical protein ACFQGT_08665 [Natrialbaceae archaeon GCM10025810]|uniref:hypothetical protein n=1 Tax=Halovalidus salilacus TaxID=3075124 RepID=UPI003619AB7B
MLERADVVLAAIPALAISGLVLRSLIVLSGVGTGLLVAPLRPIGFVAAFVLVWWELLVGPTASRAAEEET